MRFRPALERSKAVPPAHAVALFSRPSVPVENRHVAVGVASDRETFVAQEFHTGAQHWFDVVEIHPALGGIGVAPILTGADQTNILVRLHAEPRTIANEARRPGRRHRVRLRSRNAVAHAAPIGVLHHLAAQGLSKHRYTLGAAQRREQRFVIVDRRAQHFEEHPDPGAMVTAAGPALARCGNPGLEGSALVPIGYGNLVGKAGFVQITGAVPMSWTGGASETCRKPFHRRARRRRGGAGVLE